MAGRATAGGNTEALIVDLDTAQVNRQIFDQVQQMDKQCASGFVALLSNHMKNMITIS